MRDKLLNLMKSEGLTSSRLAEILEIQPSGISHILAGRNKPGFDLLQKILRRFPQINPDWLLLDSDQIYRTDATNYAGVSKSSDSLFDELPTPETIITQHTTTTTQQSAAPATAVPHSSSAIADNLTQLRSAATNAEAVRVVIFYADQSCESFSVRK